VWATLSPSTAPTYEADELPNNIPATKLVPTHPYSKYSSVCSSSSVRLCASLYPSIFGSGIRTPPPEGKSLGFQYCLICLLASSTATSKAGEAERRNQAGR